jgi:WD40 repeat protein
VRFRRAALSAARPRFAPPARHLPWLALVTILPVLTLTPPPFPALATAGRPEVIPVETWFVSQVAFVGSELAVMRELRPLQIGQPALGALELHSWLPGAQPLRRFYFPMRSRVLAFSADGLSMVHDQGAELVVRDTRTGVELARLRAGSGRETVTSVALAGRGEHLLILAAAGATTTLWDARGQRLRDYAISGTTPTITRVYTGRGSYHHNILRDQPSWPVQVALSDDGRRVAVGGSDSRVRLFDRAAPGRPPRLLEFPWTFRDRRMMGANPDLNPPVDLRFEAGGRRLRAIHRHGDVLVWDTATGRQRSHLRGTCTVEEATTLVNRYQPAGQPRRAPTAEEREGCGAAINARFSADLGLLATTTSFDLRVRRVPDGAPVALLTADRLPGQYFAWSGDAAHPLLAMVNIYGAIASWSPDQGLVHHQPARPSGPLDPLISDDGRILRFASPPERSHAWDLVTGRRLTLPSVEPGTRVLQLSPDATHLAVTTADGTVEVRRVDSRQVVARHVTGKAGGGAGAEAHFAAADSRVAVVTLDAYPRQPVRVCTAAPSGAPPSSCAALATDEKPRRWTVSPDGRWIAGYITAGNLTVWDARLGTPVFSAGGGVRHAAFSADGEWIGWLEQPAPRQRLVVAHVRRLRGAGSEHQHAFTGWPQAIALAPDGGEALVLLEGDVWRWTPSSDAAQPTQDTDLIGARRVAYARGGRSLLFTSYNRVAVRRNDAAMTPVSVLYPLLSGGWLAVSADGALDGSADAVDSLVTRGPAGQVQDGRPGWNAAHVPGVHAQALRGVSLAPSPAAPTPRSTP